MDSKGGINMDNQSLIVAVDFDGILCENQFPDIGKPNYEMIMFIRQLQDVGVETILWTSRVDSKLDKAVAWCEDRGLHFASINAGAPSNLEEFGTDPRKVAAHIYIDDNSPWFKEYEYKYGYDKAVQETIRLVKLFVEDGGIIL